MSYLIRKWHLPYEQEKEDKHNFRLKPIENWLESLKKVNVLIGPNNSGKSRFLRHLFGLKNEFFSPSSFDLDYLLELIREIKDIIKEHFSRSGIPDIEKAYRDIFLEQLTPSNFIISKKPRPLDIDSLMKGIRDFTKGTIKSYLPEWQSQDLVRVSTPILEKVTEVADHIDVIRGDFGGSYSFYKIYIPVLRGLRPFLNPGDLYKERTERDYYPGTEFEDKEIFTGLEMFARVDGLFNGNFEERSLLNDYEQFISRNFFEKEEFRLYPRKGSDVLFVKLGIEDEFPIHKLGDGIQQLIIITFPLFVNKGRDVLVFIEEPELYLHPGLQRRLLELLTGDELGSVQTFLTTHSNHFLDMSLDYSEVSTHKCFKTLEQDGSNMQFFVENCSVKDRNIMELLGVKNSSVLLSNCTIWVEGITDRLYIRKYLEIYMKEEDGKIFEEDRHFSFVEYSGNNITHWSFLEHEEDPINVESLCGTLFLVADRDDARRANTRHTKLVEVLKDRYYRLKCREIENLLSKEVLLATIRDFKNAELKENPKVAYKDYRARPLGAFIDRNILTKVSNKTFAAKSGTVNCKFDFAKKALAHIECMDDMTKEAQDLAAMLYEFIKKRNE